MIADGTPRPRSRACRNTLVYTISDGRGGVASASIVILGTPGGFYQPTVRVMKPGFTATAGAASFDVTTGTGQTALMSAPPAASFTYEVDVVSLGVNSGFVGVASQAWFDGGGQYSSPTRGTGHWYVSASHAYGDSSGAMA